MHSAIAEPGELWASGTDGRLKLASNSPTKTERRGRTDTGCGELPPVAANRLQWPHELR